MAKKEESFENWQSLVTDNFVAEDVGLPSYWTPELGKMFQGTVMGVDDKDPNFIRYQIMASKPMICKKGPADDAEEIEVLPGTIFTTSAYAALPLDFYIGFEVQVICVKTRKLPGNEASRGAPRDIWEFKVLVAPETKKALDVLRKQDAEKQRAWIRENRLKAMNILSSGNSNTKTMKAADTTAPIT